MKEKKIQSFFLLRSDWNIEKVVLRETVPDPRSPASPSSITLRGRTMHLAQALSRLPEPEKAAVCRAEEPRECIVNQTRDATEIVDAIRSTLEPFGVDIVEPLCLGW